MKHSVYIYILLIINVLIGCSEDIDLELSSTASHLVVDGHLYDVPSDLNFVRLTMSTDYFQNQPSPVVHGANVVVSDGVNDYQFVENEAYGYYEAPTLFAAEHGRTYTLTISGIDTNADGELETYTASSATPPTYVVDSAQCVYDDFFDAYRVKLFAPEDTASTDFYMFGIALNDSLISTSYTTYALTDDKWFTSDYCWGATVYLFSDEDLSHGEVSVGDKVTLISMSVTEEFFNYVSALGDITYGSNPMFSSTPANAIGNISGDALGFFTVMAVVQTSCEVRKE